MIASFEDKLPAKFVRKLAADGEDRRLRLGFTSKNVRAPVRIVLGLDGQHTSIASEEASGWDWQLLSAGNSPVETLVLEDSFLVYETAQYTGWQNFVDRYREVAVPTMTEVAGVTAVLSLSLEYFDRFVFHGEASEARPDDLFPNISAQLHADAAGGKELWHYYRGWFEQTSGLKLLVNQNLDAQDAQLADGKAARSVQMMTKTELRLGVEGFESQSLETHLNVMHSRSIHLFRSIINPSLHAQVGLADKKNV